MGHGPWVISFMNYIGFLEEDYGQTDILQFSTTSWTLYSDLWNVRDVNICGLLRSCNLQARKTERMLYEHRRDLPIQLLEVNINELQWSQARYLEIWLNGGYWIDTSNMVQWDETFIQSDPDLFSETNSDSSECMG